MTYHRRASEFGARTPSDGSETVNAVAIGRADRLAELRAGSRGAHVFRREFFQAASRQDLRVLLRTPPALARAPSSTPARPAAAPRETVQESAAHLAELLTPLPGALAEITTKISRHCAVAGRDAELAHMVEALRGRIFVLSCAVYRLAAAAAGERRT